MRITFILPGVSKVPVGGYKIIYEYADGLAGRGHLVSVCHTLKLPFYKNRRYTFLRYIKHYTLKTYKPRWFVFKNHVHLRLISEIENQYIPDGDAIIATLWATSFGVKTLEQAKGEKYYLIQGYETWDGGEEYVDESYRLGLHNIVISSWLRDKIISVDGNVRACIPNGIDLDHFRCKTPIDERDPNSVLMMYHESAWKNSRTGIAALELVKDALPAVSASLFGVYKRPRNLPRWITYLRNPSPDHIVDLYNNHSVFLSPGHIEGFSLPPAEAMACGCGVVAADNKGVREYLIHQKTGILSPEGTANSLADNMLHLMRNPDLRMSIAVNGTQHIQSFSGQKALLEFEKVIGDGNL